MKRFLPLALLSVLALGLVVAAGCGAKAQDAKLLEAHQWRVTRLGDVAYTGSAAITTTFSSGKIAGSTGVNRYSGTYETPRGSDISIKVGPMTLIAGPPAAMKAEQEFVQGMNNAASYAVDEQSLTLFDASGAAVVTYAVYQPTPLVSTKWKLTMYNNGRGGFQSVLATSDATAVFAADGTVSGNGGVNQYNGTYKTSGTNGITVSGISSTKMMGPEEVQAQEDAYLSALEKVATYAIEGDRLEMRDATGAAMVGYTAQ